MQRMLVSSPSVDYYHHYYVWAEMVIAQWPDGTRPHPFFVVLASIFQPYAAYEFDVDSLLRELLLRPPIAAAASSEQLIVDRFEVGSSYLPITRNLMKPVVVVAAVGIVQSSSDDPINVIDSMVRLTQGRSNL